MRTRFTSRPRMIGRLDAPGAKLDPVMPGFSKRRSPRVEAPLRRNSSLGTTVMVANWSVTIGTVPTSVSMDGAAGWFGAGRAGARRTIGLATVTSTCGNAVCAQAVVSQAAQAQENALYDANIMFKRRRITNSGLIGMTCAPVGGDAGTGLNRGRGQSCSDGAGRGACLERELDALEHLRGLQSAGPGVWMIDRGRRQHDGRQHGRRCQVDCGADGAEVMSCAAVVVVRGIRLWLRGRGRCR